MRRVGAKRSGVERSEIQGSAEDDHSRRLEIREKEERDRAGYAWQPQDLDEVRFWASRAVWPVE
jgi:hypothetical protein